MLYNAKANENAKEGKEKKCYINKKTLEGGLEPPTLWLTATRSNQLSYSSLLMTCYLLF